MVSHHLLPLLLFTLLLSFLPAGNSDDRAALILLSSAVRGSTLRWNQSSPTPCSWEGVTCNTTTNRVTELRLPGDRLSGQIPPNSIGNLTHLRSLSLRHNSLSGPLPPDLDSCTALNTLVLKGNQFSGQIPATLFRLINLVRLDLSGNNFSGEILPEFNNLAELKTLYLENNQFIGSIPELNFLSKLKKFNVSFNRLNGSIPSSLAKFPPESFAGNSLSPLPLSPNKGNKLSGGAIAGIAIGSVIALLLILFVCFILWRRHTIAKTSGPVKMSPVPRSPAKQPPEFEHRNQNPVIVREREIHVSSNEITVTERPRAAKVIRSGGNEGLVFFGEGGGGDFSLEDLLRASAEVLGKGTCGTTYKAYFEGGGEVIVKRLRNVCVSEKEFRERVEGLGEVVHENLVPLKAYFYNRDEKLLVNDFMPMGSLFALLHGGAARAPLTWEFRSRIALEAALGIEYLHSLGSNLTHGNIKSSNIFLTDQNRARISEFGITQLLSSSTPDLNGYCAPEVMDTRRISKKADVYSFGVLLLELLTGKAPTDPLEEEGVHLARWVQSVVEEKWTIDVFDSELLRYQNMEKQMVQLLQLAISCTSEYPERRPHMATVTRQIKKICGLSTSLT